MLRNFRKRHLDRHRHDGIVARVDLILWKLGRRPSVVDRVRWYLA